MLATHLRAMWMNVSYCERLWYRYDKLFKFVFLLLYESMRRFSNHSPSCNPDNNAL